MSDIKKFKKYEKWPKEIKAIAKKHRKKLDAERKASAGITIPENTQKALTQVFVDEASYKFAKFLGIDLTNPNDQDKFLLDTMPRVLSVLTDGTLDLPDGVVTGAPPEDPEKLQQELQRRTAEVVKSKNMDPESWPLVIQICSSILEGWEQAESPKRTTKERSSLITRVVGVVIGTVWDSNVFPFIAVVKLCMQAIVNVYVELHASGRDFPNPCLACFSA